MQSLRSPEIHHAVVDGVEVRWIDAPPPYAGIMMFRVGAWDETLVTSGITHLVEHLALTPLMDRRHPYNGAVAGRVTAFFASGAPDDVGGYFEALCRSLADLPLDRLETEARVLAAESLARPGSFYADLVRANFGAQGPGLAAFPEVGLNNVTAEAVTDWSVAHFTKANAIVLFTGPPPAELTFALPPGSHRSPSPALDPTSGRPPQGQVRFGTQPAGICLGSVVTRDPAIVLAGDILGERLQRRLRHELGLVYHVITVYEPLGRDTAFLFFAADGEPSRAADVSFVFMECVRDFAARGPTQEEFERALGAPDPTHVDPVAFMRDDAGRLVQDELCGDRIIRVEEISELRRDLGLEDIAKSIEGVLEACYVMCHPDYGGGLVVPRLFDDQPLLGAKFRGRRGRDVPFDSIVLANEGVSVVRDGGALSFMFEKLAGYSVFGSSARTLTNLRGDSIQIDGDDWRRGSRLITEMDRAVPDRLTIRHTE